MKTEYEEKKKERRSFSCPNKLWEKLKKETKDCYSISTFICHAIKEKMKKE